MTLPVAGNVHTSHADSCAILKHLTTVLSGPISCRAAPHDKVWIRPCMA
jgi:hypothetical protein